MLPRYLKAIRARVAFRLARTRARPPAIGAVVAVGSADDPRTSELNRQPCQLIMLRDPDTVFPVVIDPSWSMDETHALRVTQTFHKYDSDIGSTAKLGYNGWTSPYYKSRMFYQFKWPLNDDDSIVNAAQIAGATFKYKQTYSPQSSCSDNDFWK